MEKTLSDLMDFDHIIRVTDAGTVVDARSVFAYFELNVAKDGTDEFSIPNGWELLKGFTGQYGYNGPVMHPSEFIGGGLERHILENPGYYVALVVTANCEYDGSTDCDVEQGCDCEPAGWAVAFKPCVMVRDVYHYGSVRTERVAPLEEIERDLFDDAFRGATRETLAARQANVRKAIATLQETGTDNSWGWHTLTVVEAGE